MIYNYITSKNGARQLMSEVTKDDVIRFVLTETVKIFNAISSYFYDSEEIQKLSQNELLDLDCIARELGYSSVSLMDTFVSPKGYRILSKVQRIPGSVIDNLVNHFESFKPLEYDYYISTGTVDEIRSNFKEISDLV